MSSPTPATPTRLQVSLEVTLLDTICGEGCRRREGLGQAECGSNHGCRVHRQQAGSSRNVARQVGVGGGGRDEQLQVHWHLQMHVGLTFSLLPSSGDSQVTFLPRKVMAWLLSSTAGGQGGRGWAGVKRLAGGVATGYAQHAGLHGRALACVFLAPQACVPRTHGKRQACEAGCAGHNGLAGARPTCCETTLAPNNSPVHSRKPVTGRKGRGGLLQGPSGFQARAGAASRATRARARRRRMVGSCMGGGCGWRGRGKGEWDRTEGRGVGKEGRGAGEARVCTCGDGSRRVSAHARVWCGARRATQVRSGAHIPSPSLPPLGLTLGFSNLGSSAGRG